MTVRTVPPPLANPLDNVLRAATRTRGYRSAPAIVLTASWLIIAATMTSTIIASDPDEPLRLGVGVPVSMVLALAVLVSARQITLLVAGVAASRRGCFLAPTRIPDTSTTTVALLYTTCDDFDPDPVLRSMRQTHALTRTILLDDSRDAAVRAAVDAFARQHRVEVVRRTRRTGWKAGNVNAWLLTQTDVEYAVLLDSDQSIGETFIVDALARVAAHPGAAIIQGRIATLDATTRFACWFANMGAEHLAAQLAGRAAIGAGMFAGRGALLDIRALQAVGGFPEVVMEDTALALRLSRAGHSIIWAPELASIEAAPVDRAAFAVQFGKFAQGATHLLRTEWSLLFDSRLSPARRADVALDLASPLVAALLPAAVTTLAFVEGAAGSTALPAVIGALLALLGMVPLVPEVVRRISSGERMRAVVFSIRASMLYISVALVAVRAVVKVLLGACASFAVTPKRTAGIGLRGGIVRCRVELGVAALTAMLALAVVGNPSPAAAWAATACAGVILEWRGSRPA